MQNGFDYIIWYINHFKEAKKVEKFGNGRYVRNLFEKIKFEQADRIVKTNSQNKNTITVADVKCVLDDMDIECGSKKLHKIGF